MSYEYVLLYYNIRYLVYSSTAVTLARLQVRVLDFPFAILDRLKTGGKRRGGKSEKDLQKTKPERVLLKYRESASCH